MAKPDSTSARAGALDCRGPLPAHTLNQFKAAPPGQAEHAPIAQRGRSMEKNAYEDHDEPQDEPVPAMQQLLDNPFLLLFIGIAMPTVLYIVWGVMEIVNIPVAK
jgi:hypothetical protein